ncbi:MAG TPA: glycosyltransferase family protein [Flavitalea sp.]|nr:glycosyltransferase family protein [Flavitalea sp.]
MKILYAIQATGNGHLSRARDIVPILQKKGEVDILVSGTEADIELPFDIAYRFKGLSFIFGKKGGVDLLKTYKKSRLKRLMAEIKSLPVENYHIVISDFEPVSSWACYFKNKKCISLSHQAGVISKASPQPKHTDLLGRAILRHYAPASVRYGFHFKPYAEHIFTPVIRKQVRETVPANEGHYTVYLPAYSDQKIAKILNRCKGVKWEVFSKRIEKPYTIRDIHFFPINNEAFIKSMASSAGVLCGAGFETPAEALYLGKKLMVIPMKHQYEQHCNAAALEEMGVPVLKKLKSKKLERIISWICASTTIQVDYPDNTEKIIDQVLSHHREEIQKEAFTRADVSANTFRSLTLKKILSRLAGQHR